MVQFTSSVRMIFESMWIDILKSLDVIGTELFLQYIQLSQKKDIDNLFRAISSVEKEVWDQLIITIGTNYSLQFFFHFHQHEQLLKEFVNYWKLQIILLYQSLPKEILLYIVSYIH